MILIYRYGFNGKEHDDDMDGNDYDYGFRIYNPQIGKFLSVDRLGKKYPWYTPYQFAGNTPIQAIDLDGLEPAYVYTDDKTGKSHITVAGDHLTSTIPESQKANFLKTNGKPGLGDGIQAAKGILLVGAVAASVGVLADVEGAWGVAKNLYNIFKKIDKGESTPKPTPTKPNPYLNQTEEQLNNSKQSYENLIKEHQDKLEQMREDPIKMTKPEKLEQMQKDNPTKDVLLQRLKNQEKEVLDQINKQEGELKKVNEAISIKKQSS